MRAKILDGDYKGTEFEVSDETIKNIGEQTKWKHGDIALSYYFHREPAKRLILIENGNIKIYRHDGFCMYSCDSQKDIRNIMREYRYEKIGNLFDDFSKEIL